MCSKISARIRLLCSGGHKATFVICSECCIDGEPVAALRGKCSLEPTAALMRSTMLKNPQVLCLSEQSGTNTY